MNQRITKKAFTLIELLVVIAIIAILATILLPSLNKARDLAKQTKCKSQQRSLGTSFALYASDNNDNLPRGNLFNFPWAGPTDDQFVAIVLKPYIDEATSQFYCPFVPLSIDQGEVEIGGAYYNITYNYLGNYPYEQIFNPAWPQALLSWGEPDYAESFSDNGQPVILLIDRLINTVVPHENPNTLYTDGSVQQRDVDEIEYRLNRPISLRW